MDQQQKKQLLFYFIILSSWWFVYQICFLISSYLPFTFFQLIFGGGLRLPLVAWMEGTEFFLLQIALSFAFTVIIWGAYCLASQVLKISSRYFTLGGLIWWGIFLLGMLFVNQHFFPNSAFSFFTREYLCPDWAANGLLVFFVLIMATGVFLAVFELARQFFSRYWKYKKAIMALAVLGIALFEISYFMNDGSETAFLSQHRKTNIILIGLDDVRPDFVSYFGATQVHTPAIDAFLKQSRVFTQAYTPLAQTYPAWVSILTGLYPKHHQMRFDLMNDDVFDASSSLAENLRALGYQTFFATDEAEYGHITEKFGFDRVIEPKVNSDDYLFSIFNDFPWTNFLVNTFVGRYLFPHSYANRVAYVTYDRHVFNHFVEKQLILDPSKPLFLGIHFCMPHSPYRYVQLKMPLTATGYELYLKALEEGDRQFLEFLAMLQRKGILDNALVILFSDHGESFGLKGDLLIAKDTYFPRKKFETWLQSLEDHHPLKEALTRKVVGHGSDVLALTQYHPLLAVRGYGSQKVKAGNDSRPVSLIDIKPTVSAALHLTMSRQSDGINLLSRSVNNRPIFVETGLYPSALRSNTVVVSRILSETTDLLQVDSKTNQIILRPEAEPFLTTQKQRAVYWGHWAMALYPDQQGRSTAVLVDCRTGQWSTDLYSAWAKKTPAVTLLSFLKRFYGDEIRI